MTWVFLISAALVVYILAGWPLLLAVWSRAFGRAPQRQFAPRKVSVILAVHNGERYLAAKLDSIFALNYPRELLEVFVASDGSSDRTAEIAQAYSGVTLLQLPRGGKCRALNAAVARATGEILFFTDVRQQLSADSLRNLVSYFADPKVGAVSGELKIRAGATSGEQNVGLYWRMEVWIRKHLSHLDSLFGATGCIYALRRELAVPIPEDILLDDMFLPLAAYFRGYRLVMTGDAIAWDEPTSAKTEFGRKVRTLAGNYQLFRHYPQLLAPGANRMWFHFVSYKLARLILPWILLVMLVGSFGLPQPLGAILPVAQLAAYGLALADGLLPEGSLVKKVSSPAHAFLTMMAASAMAVRIFFVDARSLWNVTGATKH